MVSPPSIPPVNLAGFIKLRGNVNRLREMLDAGMTVAESADVFKKGHIVLVVRNGDIPLIENLQALTRKGLPKSSSKDAIRSSRPSPDEPLPT